MSILAFVGLPGSGKSYGVVANVILPALRMERTVVTNIPLHLEEIYREFTLGKVIQFATDDVTSSDWWLENCPPGSVVIIDECWKFWPAGKRQSDYEPEELSFFAEHRHRVDDKTKKTTEIYLVTQDLSQISACVRDLVETTYIAQKLTALGARKKFRVDVYTGSVKGQRGPKGRRINSLIGQYKPSIYRFYKSATHSVTVGDELKVDNRASIWRSPAVRIVIPIGLALAIIGGISSYHNFQSMTGQDKKPPSSSVASPVAAPVSPQAKSAMNLPVSSQPGSIGTAVASVFPSGPVESVRWRLAAVLDVNGSPVVWISNGRGTRRIDASNCELRPGYDQVCTWRGELVASGTGPVNDPLPYHPFLPVGTSATVDAPAPVVAAVAPVATVVQGVPGTTSAEGHEARLVPGIPVQ